MALPYFNLVKLHKLQQGPPPLPPPLEILSMPMQYITTSIKSLQGGNEASVNISMYFGISIELI